MRVTAPSLNGGMVTITIEASNDHKERAEDPWASTASATVPWGGPASRPVVMGVPVCNQSAIVGTSAPVTLRRQASTVARVQPSAFQDADVTMRQERTLRAGVAARHVGLVPELSAPGPSQASSSDALPYAGMPSMHTDRRSYGVHALRGAFGRETELRMAAACGRT